MSKVLIIGGYGFYGDRVAQGLIARGHAVARGTRSARGRADAVEIDLTEPAGFSVLDDFAVIINCSDSVGAAPDQAIAHVLASGGVWLEMGADAPSFARLLSLRPAAVRGTAILGVGVFPGMSTLLARAVAEDGPRCERLELAIKVSPLSGAGWGTCALMAESLFVPATRYEDGELLTTRTALGRTTALPFPEQPWPSTNSALPDTLLIHRATGVPNITASLALVPRWLRFNLGALAMLCWLLRPLRAVLVPLLTWQLFLLRTVLLRGVESSLQLLVIADRGQPGERSRVLSFDDGQQATADGTVAAVEAWLQEETHRPGLFSVAEYFTLDQLTAAMHD